ncbi:hypothetical protein GYMLUDRAFT_578915 [Collybiopsis luxurians FD-317 M1]|uniref:Uncharacterized protein n=1 Tax=Collybiopsis luxurians FD-317 M1 TaxID=944289 RepID=A0A0D0CRH5_9AGAR|nr:hypothetical protein GYMLUDRAFT_578915 [Collybiopsis luxurians FD-317 M1]
MHLASRYSFFSSSVYLSTYLLIVVPLLPFSLFFMLTRYHSSSAPLTSSLSHCRSFLLPLPCAAVVCVFCSIVVVFAISPLPLSLRCSFPHITSYLSLAPSISIPLLDP